MFKKRTINPEKWIQKKRRGSPLMEEGILIALGLFCFLLLLGVIMQILDWFGISADDALRAINGL
ncbi:MAG: hypothetical protein ACXAB4_03620 [Candidatus Hodarchaeales archaeon]|jgi:hypothetical protein